MLLAVQVVSHSWLPAWGLVDLVNAPWGAWVWLACPWLPRHDCKLLNLHLENPRQDAAGSRIILSSYYPHTILIYPLPVRWPLLEQAIASIHCCHPGALMCFVWFSLAGRAPWHKQSTCVLRSTCAVLVKSLCDLVSLSPVLPVWNLRPSHNVSEFLTQACHDANSSTIAPGQLCSRLSFWQGVLPISAWCFAQRQIMEARPGHVLSIYIIVTQKNENATYCKIRKPWCNIHDNQKRAIQLALSWPLHSIPQAKHSCRKHQKHHGDGSDLTSYQQAISDCVYGSLVGDLWETGESQMQTGKGQIFIGALKVVVWFGPSNDRVTSRF